MNDTPQLFHFTCWHSHRQIKRTALRPLLLPQSRHPVSGLPPLLWLTTQPSPDPEATGLTSHTIQCDRMDFRYLARRTAACIPWLGSEFRASASPAWVAEAEAPGHDPENWLVSGWPVPARWDQAWSVARVGARSAARATAASGKRAAS